LKTKKYTYLLLRTGNRQEKPSNHHQVTETPSTTTNRNAFLCQEREQRRRRLKRNGVCLCYLWAKEEEKVSGSYVYFRTFKRY